MTLSTHKVEVVRVKLLPHPNADSLSLVPVFGYQVVVRTEEWRDGQLAAYIPPDSVVPVAYPYEFLWKDKLGAPTVQQRRIRARRFRGEWSQGLLVLPPADAQEGEDVAEALQITHYEPPQSAVTRADAEHFRTQRSWVPRSWRGWLHLGKYLLGLADNCHGLREAGPDELYPKYDVDTWYRYKDLLVEGEPVVITEKIHGSNARYVYAPGGWFGKGRMYCGSRSEWKRRGNNIWWQVLDANPWIEEFCRATPGVALYGEVTPTQDLKYGGTLQLHVFDIRRDGKWLDWPDFNGLAQAYHLQMAPEIFMGAYVAQRIPEMAIGKSYVQGADHLREGIVIRPLHERTHPSIGRVQLKAVSPEYLERSKG